MKIMFVLTVFFCVASTGTNAQDLRMYRHPDTNHWYPSHCCSNNDCYPVPAGEISMDADGCAIVGSTGERFCKRNRIYLSEDGQWHRCSLHGEVTGNTICIFYPALF